MSASPDVLIVGGGVIGLTTAWFLRQAGATVTILDQADFGQESSWAGAGILPVAPTLSRAQTGMEKLAGHSARLFPGISNQLREQTGIDTGYRTCGGIELVESGFEQNLIREWDRFDIPVESLSEERLAEIEPALDPQKYRPLLTPTVSQTRNPRHVKALITMCRSLGAQLKAGCPVFDFERTGSRIGALRTAEGRITAGKYLITSGAWTASLLEPLGIRVRIAPVRGQIALLKMEAPLFQRIIQCGVKYLVPRPDGRVLIGATEEDVGFHKQTTVAGISELLAFGASLVPELRDAQLEKCWAGLRPGSPNGIPYLGRTPGINNLFVAAGHFRAGIQLSPGTALVMKELLLDEPLSFSMDDFRVDRDS